MISDIQPGDVIHVPHILPDEDDDIYLVIDVETGDQIAGLVQVITENGEVRNVVLGLLAHFGRRI